MRAVRAWELQYVRSVSPDHIYYRWRREYGGLNLDQENARLKRTVADLALDKQILKEAAEGNF